ncbi:MAG: hypothetical protein ABII79_11380 [bacterium]
MILRHLCGETDVAIPFGWIVDQVVLDIDFEGNRAWGDVESTTRGAIRAIPGEPLVYQSSDSGGLRLIWFLSTKMKRTHLYRWVKSRLRDQGVTVQNGVCEIRLGTSPDRLPFGYFSMLVDPILLEPHYHVSLAETLKIVREHREWHAIDIESDSADDFCSSRSSGSDFTRDMETLLSNGLPWDVTTNDCLMKLAWFGRVRKRLQEEQLKAFLRDWICQKHNGFSTRVNEGRIQDIYDQIDRIVHSLHAVPGPLAYQANAVGLGETEMRCLLQYPGNFKTIEGAFKILCYAKSKLHRIKSRSSTICTGGGDGTNKWGTVFHPAEGIPNGARNFPLFVNLGKQHLRRLRVPFASNTARIVGELERLGTLALKRKAWPDGDKSRQYWVNFPFDLADAHLYDDFDEALWRIVGWVGIKKRFSAYQAKRIGSKMRNDSLETGVSEDELPKSK